MCRPFQVDGYTGEVECCYLAEYQRLGVEGTKDFNIVNCTPQLGIATAPVV